MAETRYPYGPGTYDSDRLRAAILAAGLPAPSGLYGSGYAGPGTLATSMLVGFDPALTTGQKTTLDGVIAAHDSRPRVVRPLLAIYNDLAALSSVQKTNIWTNLTSGNPVKISLDTGPNAGYIFLLWRIASNSSLPAATIADMKLTAAVYYVQDNPGYLNRPIFDSTINIPGDQLA